VIRPASHLSLPAGDTSTSINLPCHAPCRSCTSMQVITGWVGCNVCSPHALQVQCPNLPSSVCEAARRMGGDKVRPALELVGCAEEVEKAIKYTFGTSFVCQVGDTHGGGGERSCAWGLASGCFNMHPPPSMLFLIVCATSPFILPTSHARPLPSPALQDSGTAKKLAYSREVHQRCITLQGDDFNPSGLLTGGSRANQASVLSGLHELAQAEAK